jgi:hypothetical protein
MHIRLSEAGIKGRLSQKAIFATKSTILLAILSEKFKTGHHGPILGLEIIDWEMPEMV